MLRKTIVLLLMLAVLWVSGCVTAGSSNAGFGPCASRMDVRYCGPGG